MLKLNPFTASLEVRYYNNVYDHQVRPGVLRILILAACCIGLLSISPTHLFAEGVSESAGQLVAVNFGPATEHETYVNNLETELGKLDVSTPAYSISPSEFAPPLGKYTFSTSWQGIPAATSTISVEQDGLTYKITASAKSVRAIDLFYKLRFQGEGTLSAVDMRPMHSFLKAAENSKVKTAKLTFDGNGTIHSVRERTNREREEIDFRSNNLTLDPFAAIFIARGLEWEVGKTHKFDVFNGKTRYLISLTAEDLTTAMVNGERVKVWVITPGVNQLPEATPHKKLKAAKIYVTADNRREILMITSEVFIGTVTTELVEFIPGKQAFPSVHLAGGTALNTELEAFRRGVAGNTGSLDIRIR